MKHFKSFQPQPIIICCFFILSIMWFQTNWMDKDITQVYITPKIWVSLSVCYSSNTKFYDKKFFPYNTATQLSTRLWHSLTNHSVVVQVIYEESADSEKLMKFVKDLRTRAKAKVELVKSSPNLACSLQAQLQRMFAFQMPYIDSQDIIVTSDVDTFIMDPKIFAPLYLPKYKIWAFQYNEVLEFGFTFNMNFIAMRSQLWRKVMNTTSPESLVNKYRKSLDLKKDITMWDYDQTIISRILMEHQLCAVPPENELWKKVKLTPPEKAIDDSDVCFHGMGAWKDCNVKRTQVEGGCKRWHFHPFERNRHLMKKYKEIMDNAHIPIPLTV